MNRTLTEAVASILANNENPAKLGFVDNFLKPSLSFSGHATSEIINYCQRADHLVGQTPIEITTSTTSAGGLLQPLPTHVEPFQWPPKTFVWEPFQPYKSVSDFSLNLNPVQPAISHFFRTAAIPEEQIIEFLLAGVKKERVALQITSVEGNNYDSITVSVSSDAGSHYLQAGGVVVVNIYNALISRLEAKFENGVLRVWFPNKPKLLPVVQVIPIS